MTIIEPPKIGLFALSLTCFQIPNPHNIISCQRLPAPWPKGPQGMSSRLQRMEQVHQGWGLGLIERKERADQEVGWQMAECWCHASGAEAGSKAWGNLLQGRARQLHSASPCEEHLLQQPQHLCWTVKRSLFTASTPELWWITCCQVRGCLTKGLPCQEGKGWWPQRWCWIPKGVSAQFGAPKGKCAFLATTCWFQIAWTMPMASILGV